MHVIRNSNTCISLPGTGYVTLYIRTVIQLPVLQSKGILKKEESQSFIIFYNRTITQ
jgi:hypothetical protein